MAVSSYANLFGTTGAGRQGSKAGIGTLFGQQAAPYGADDEERMRKQQQSQLTGQAQQTGQAPAPQPTFAEQQKMGRARPAPPAATAQPAMLQQLEGQLGVGGPSGMAVLKALPATQPAPGAPASATGMGEMLPMKPPGAVPAAAPAAAPAGAPGAPTGASLAQTLQAQLTSLLQPGGYTDTEFERLKAAQEANLRAEYGAEQTRLNEELARRGLSASSIGAGRMGDLAGQQARALATMQASLLGEQAKLRQQARETGLATMSDLTRTMLTNEQAQAETRLKEQLGMSEIGGVMYRRGPDGSLVPMTDAEGKQIETLAAREVARKYGIAEAEVTGMFGGRETLPARTQRQNMAIQLAQVLAGSDDPEVLKNILPYIYEAFGITPPAEKGAEDTATTTTTKTQTPIGPITSTVPQVPAAPNIPGVPGGKPGVPAPTREEIPPIGDTGKGAPSKPRPRGLSFDTPAPGPVAAPAKPTMATGGTGGVSQPVEFIPSAPQPVLYEGPATPALPTPTSAPTPAPAPRRTLEEVLTEILTPAPELYPAPVAMPAPLPSAPERMPQAEPAVAPSPVALPVPGPVVASVPRAVPGALPEPTEQPPRTPEPAAPDIVKKLQEILPTGLEPMAPMPEPILLPAEPVMPAAPVQKPAMTEATESAPTPEPMYDLPMAPYMPSLPEPIYIPEPAYIPPPMYTPEMPPDAAPRDVLRELADVLQRQPAMPGPVYVPETFASPAPAPVMPPEMLDELYRMLGYGSVNTNDYSQEMF